MTDHQQPPTLDLIWGAEAIAKAICQTRRATYHMLEAGELPARQVGRRWVVSRKELEAFFARPAATN